MHVLEVVFVSEKTALEVGQTKLEEERVVFSLEDRVADVAHQVLEKGAHYNVHYLANLQVDFLLERGRLVILFEVHAARNVLFSRSFIQLT